jgi:hypothetical protein
MRSNQAGPAAAAGIVAAVRVARRDADEIAMNVRRDIMRRIITPLEPEVV